MQAESLSHARFDALLLIENIIRSHGGEFKKEDIWKQITINHDYQMFQEIFRYFLDSKKIAIDSDGFVCWTYNPELVKKYRNNPSLRIL